MVDFYKRATKGRLSTDEKNLIKTVQNLIDKDTTGVVYGVVEKHGVSNSYNDLKKMHTNIKKAMKSAASKTPTPPPTPKEAPVETPPVAEPTPPVGAPIETPVEPVEKVAEKSRNKQAYTIDRDEANLVKKLVGELKSGKGEPPVSADPLDEDPNIRDYAIGSPSQPAPNVPIAEPNDDIPAAGQDTVPENVIPEAKFIPPTNTISEEDIETFEPPPPEPDVSKGGGGSAPPPPKNTPPPRQDYEDLNPSQKRKAAKQTAEMLLGVYCQYIPEVYKFFVKIPFKKLDKIISAGEINLDTAITNQGEDMTVKQYFDGLRGSIDTLFEVDEETRQNILEPLIEVLMEKELALTPMQRLMFAIAQDQVNKMTCAIQLTVMVNSGINQMIALEKEKIEAINAKTEAMDRQTQAMDRQTQAKKRAQETEENEDKKEEESEGLMSGASAAEMAAEILDESEIEPVE